MCLLNSADPAVRACQQALMATIEAHNIHNVLVVDQHKLTKAVRERREGLNHAARQWLRMQDDRPYDGLDEMEDAA